MVELYIRLYAARDLWIWENRSKLSRVCTRVCCYVCLYSTATGPQTTIALHGESSFTAWFDRVSITTGTTSMVSLSADDFTHSGNSLAGDGGVLQVTQVTEAGGQMGFASIPVDVTPTDTVMISFEMYFGAAGYEGSKTLGADGGCMNLGAGPGLAALAGRVGEDGVGTGIAVCFDEYANSNHEHGFFMHYNGAEIFGDPAECAGGWDNANLVECEPVSLFVTPGRDAAIWNTVTVTVTPVGAGATVEMVRPRPRPYHTT